MPDESLKTLTETTRFIRHGHACMGVTAPAGLILTAGDPNHSLLWSRQGDNSGKTHAWSPWGHGTLATACPALTVNALTRSAAATIWATAIGPIIQY
jgi:hypothetical protein